jgi:hypothetical protein
MGKKTAAQMFRSREGCHDELRLSTLPFSVGAPNLWCATEGPEVSGNMAQELSFLICIRHMLGSNLGLYIDYSDAVSLWD